MASLRTAQPLDGSDTQELLELGVGGGCRFGGRYSGLEARDGVHTPIGASADLVDLRDLSSFRQDRNSQFEIVTALETEKARRRHTHDRERICVELDRTSDNV